MEIIKSLSNHIKLMLLNIYCSFGTSLELLLFILLIEIQDYFQTNVTGKFLVQ